MIYKFKSKATGDLIMLQPNGESILKIIGKGEASQLKQGILLPEDMARAEVVQAAHDKGQAPPPAQAVSLRQRSLPFIQMAQRCLDAKKEIVWGV